MGCDERSDRQAVVPVPDSDREGFATSSRSGSCRFDSRGDSSPTWDRFQRLSRCMDPRHRFFMSQCYRFRPRGRESFVCRCQAIRRVQPASGVAPAPDEHKRTHAQTQQGERRWLRDQGKGVVHHLEVVAESTDVAAVDGQLTRRPEVLPRRRRIRTQQGVCREREP